MLLTSIKLSTPACQPPSRVINLPVSVSSSVPTNPGKAGEGLGLIKYFSAFWAYGGQNVSTLLSLLNFFSNFKAYISAERFVSGQIGQSIILENHSSGLRSIGTVVLGTVYSRHALHDFTCREVHGRGRQSRGSVKYRADGSSQGICL